MHHRISTPIPEQRQPYENTSIILENDNLEKQNTEQKQIHTQKSVKGIIELLQLHRGKE